MAKNVLFYCRRKNIWRKLIVVVSIYILSKYFATKKKHKENKILKKVSVHFPADWADSHHQTNQSKETSLKQCKYIINFVDILSVKKVVGGTFFKKITADINIFFFHHKQVNMPHYCIMYIYTTIYQEIYVINKGSGVNDHRCKIINVMKNCRG